MAAKRTPAEKTRAAKKSTSRKPPAKKQAGAAKRSGSSSTRAKKSSPRKQASTTKKTAAKKSPAKKSSPRRRQPQQPPVEDVVEGMLDTDQADKQDDSTGAGAVEASTRRELKLLKLERTALGASALTLARLADHSDSSVGTATVLRELRMTLGTARTVGAVSGPNEPAKDEDAEENVVPESRLEALRREAAARGRGK